MVVLRWSGTLKDVEVGGDTVDAQQVGHCLFPVLHSLRLLCLFDGMAFCCAIVLWIEAPRLVINSSGKSRVNFRERHLLPSSSPNLHLCIMADIPSLIHSGTVLPSVCPVAAQRA